MVKAYFKSKVSAVAPVATGLLPWNIVVRDMIETARGEGRDVILCTASDISTAKSVSEHLGCFDEVMASDGVINLSDDRHIGTTLS